MTDVAALSGLILLANLAILGLNVKLYTEYFKDRAQDRRAAASRDSLATEGDPS